MVPKRQFVATPKSVPRTMHGLVLAIGLPAGDAYATSTLTHRAYIRPHSWDTVRPSHSFWDRHPDIHALAADCREAYRKRALELHPDRGGDAKAMAIVNASWDRIKKILRKRGADI